MTNIYRVKPEELRKDLGKEHFSIGSGKSYFNTTNKELMRSSSMPNLEDGLIKSNNSKINKMMRNHHFVFGQHKVDFRSTANDNLIPHQLQSMPLPLNIMLNLSENSFFSL